ncbi:MAG: hemin receptor [Prevotella sp.]|nr:hemin receptor [Prevotella sp.]
MKKILTLALGFTALAANAQETYESAQLATQDLNGTAKYIGMGGALEALGADISTINTNPAGVGFFRKSWAGVSAGLTSQNSSFDGVKNVANLRDNGKTNADFNQIGFVWSTRTGRDSHLNLSFNYQKSRNFNQILQAVNHLDGYSANTVNYIKAYHFQDSYTLQDHILYNVLNSKLSDGSNPENTYARIAEMYAAHTDNSGYISNFDFNISGSIHDKVFLGFTLGVKDVRYRSTNYYDEALGSETPLCPYGNPENEFRFTDLRRITGTGFDIKFGAIIRPIEESPFRFGVYINTPTWYELHSHGDMSAAAGFIANLAEEGQDPIYKSYTTSDNTIGYGYNYKYCISTPWRFGASVGHTFGKKVAIGATYEYADYSAIRNKIVDGTYVDYYGDEHLETTRDYDMDNNNDISLKGVSLLKVGAEIKPIPELAIRLGYNYQSAIYTKEGYKDISIPNGTSVDYYGYDYVAGSVGAYYSTYDFTNWEATHRLTCGLGIQLNKNWAIDLAYQYSTQKGTYYPFTTTVFDDSSTDGTEDVNIGYGTTVHNNRHQFNMTLGYRF